MCMRGEQNMRTLSLESKQKWKLPCALQTQLLLEGEEHGRSFTSNSQSSAVLLIHTYLRAVMRLDNVHFNTTPKRNVQVGFV